jgi:hypothetical protein
MQGKKHSNLGHLRAFLMRQAGKIPPQG